MPSLDRFVLVAVLKSLEWQRGRLFYRIEQPAVTEPSSERPDIAVVASNDPFEIAKSVRQVGDASILHSNADLDRILRLALPDCVHRRESQHDSQVRKQIRPVGLVRAEEAVANADLWSTQLRNVLHAPCMLHCADNSDDVHDGVRLRQRRSDDGNVGILVCPK